MQRIIASGKQRILPQINTVNTISRVPNRVPQIIVQNKQQMRQLSGHGTHAAPHHKLDPQPIKHHKSQPDDAYPFGIRPGDKLEGWEIITYGVFAVCAFIVVVGIGYCKEDDSSLVSIIIVVSSLYAPSNHYDFR